MTSMIDVSLEKESATGQTPKKNKNNRTGTTGGCFRELKESQNT